MPSLSGIPTAPIHGCTHEEIFTTEPPCNGWAAYGHYQAGFMPEPGGLLDQPEIWHQVIEACGIISGCMERYVNKKRIEKQGKK
jgi:hypothetical protein